MGGGVSAPQQELQQHRHGCTKLFDGCGTMKTKTKIKREGSSRNSTMVDNSALSLSCIHSYFRDGPKLLFTVLSFKNALGGKGLKSFTDELSFDGVLMSQGKDGVFSLIISFL